MCGAGWRPPCCRSRRPRQTTTELRVIGLGYVAKWSAEQPDISAANSLISTQPKLVQVKPTLVTFPTFPRTLAAESSMGGSDERRTGSISVVALMKVAQVPKPGGRFQIVDREMPEPDAGTCGQSLARRANRCYSSISTSTVSIFSSR